MVAIIAVTSYLLIGAAFALIRLWLIDRGNTWSLARLVDEIDGLTFVGDRERARKNIRWIWIVWPLPLSIDVFLAILLALCIIFMMILGDRNPKTG